MGVEKIHLEKEEEIIPGLEFILRLFKIPHHVNAEVPLEPHDILRCSMKDFDNRRIRENFVQPPHFRPKGIRVDYEVSVLGRDLYQGGDSWNDEKTFLF